MPIIETITIRPNDILILKASEENAEATQRAADVLSDELRAAGYRNTVFVVLEGKCTILRVEE